MQCTYTHDPLFGTLIDQGARYVPGPVEPSTTYPATDWTYRPHPWTPNRHHIGDTPWPTPHPTYPCPAIPPAIPSPFTYIITTTANNAAPTPAERPEDVIARACRELADAAARLQASADALGLDLDKRAIREAINKKLAEALGD